MKDWTTVYKSQISSRAEIVKGVLNEHEIEAVIVNKKDSTLHFSHGQIQVLVPNEKVISAKKIVEDEITFE
jgi:anaerobic glycerol-3-phosphate dehydrogenase